MMVLESFVVATIVTLSLSGQVRYMINELKFRAELAEFQTPHQPVPYYMNSASYWLGWGVFGNREQYSYDYLKRLK